MMPALLAGALALAADAPAPMPAPAPQAQAWRLFALINQPAQARRAAPQAAPAFSWQTWPTAAATFRQDGADPGPWNPDRIGIDRFEGIVPASPRLRHIEAGRMVPVTDPLTIARRLVEVRLNPVSYEFIRDRGLYTVDGQRRAVNAGPVQFPPRSLQLKAGWRPITRQQRGGYYTMTLRMADGRVRTYGLAALNLAFKTPAGTWLWASFEHSETPVSADPATAAAQSLNPPWRHYRLRGIQTTFVDAAGQATRLGNAELEAGLGDSASCMTCHARASIGLDDASAARLPVFAPAPPGVRRGYVGRPDPDWFTHADPQGQRHTVFAQLDFVWSLAQAAPRAAAIPAQGNIQ